MSEEKKIRGIKEIEQEYANLCAKAGNLQYQISTYVKELELLNGALRDLNMEATKSNAAEAAKQEEAKKDA